VPRRSTVPGLEPTALNKAEGISLCLTQGLDWIKARRERRTPCDLGQVGPPMHNTHDADPNGPTGYSQSNRNSMLLG
jgi:hypothetical protein